MSFGWSAGDIVALARLSFEIYKFCDGAPDDLRSLFEKFHMTGENLTRLANILEASGLGQWEFNHDLQKDLESCRDDLKRFSYVVDAKKSPLIKVKGLAHLAISQEKLKRIEKRIDFSNRIINEVKVDLILACSLKNLQITPSSTSTLTTGSPLQTRDHNVLGISPASNSIFTLTGPTVPTLLLPPPFVEDTDAVDSARHAISNAEEALLVARARHRVSTEDLVVNGDDDHSSDFAFEIASIAEEMELYAENANILNHPGQLKVMGSRAKTFKRRYSVVESEASRMRRNSHLSSDSAGTRGVDEGGSQTYTRYSNSTRSEATQMSRGSVMSGGSGIRKPEGRYQVEQWPQPWVPGQDIRHSHQNLNLSIDDESTATAQAAEHLQTKEKHIELSGRSRATLAAYSADAQDCSFFWSTSEGSVILTVTCHSVVKGPGFDIGYGKHCWSFKHCITTGLRPIPHLLHPSVEGPCSEPKSPYTITFTDDQFVSLSNSTQDQEWLSNLIYVFFDKQDRDLICSHIFGKSLVMSFGCSEITYEGKLVSQMSAVIVWKDLITSALSITFPPYLSDGGRKDMELKVIDLWDPEKTKAKKAAKTIELAIDKLFGPEAATSSGLPTGIDRRNSSISSTGSFFRRRFSSMSQDERSKCVLTFSDPSDRALLLAHFTC